MNINSFMPLLQSTSRLRNIFMPPQQEEFDLSELYQPDMDMQNQFGELINQFPQRPTSHTFAQKLLAGLGSMRSEDPIAYQDKALNADYYRQLNDWTNKAKVIESAASNERANNSINRQFAYNVAQDRSANRRLDIQNKYNTDRIDVAEGRAKTYQQNADTAAFKAQQSAQLARDLANGGTIQFADDGRAYLLTRTGQMKPIDVDLFSPQELQEMRDRAAMARTVQAGNNAVRTRATVPGGSPVNRPPSATQQNAAIEGRARMVSGQRPEWQKFIRIDPMTGRFIGLTEDRPDELFQAIYGMPLATSRNATPANQNRVRMINPQGVPGTVAADDVERAIAQGWKRAQ